MYTVCDYTTVGKTKNDISSTESSDYDSTMETQMDDEEKMLQMERTDCNVGGNVLLLFQKFASKFPFNNT